MILLAICLISLFSCNSALDQEKDISKEFHDYWYNNEAEISSYELNISRYGEIRKGKVALIFVTENFSPSLNTKPDSYKKDQVPVLKLNNTQNFVTGIYPYSLMTSTFLPINDPQHSLKISSSSQEWCGHSFLEMKNKGKLEFQQKSYFEGKNKELDLRKNWLEDDVMSMIRIDPSVLPTGNQKVIPSFQRLTLSHLEIKAYDCQIELSKGSDQSIYTMTYPELGRSLEITFESNFPHKILGWNEEVTSRNGQKFNTTASLIKSIKSTYWQKNRNKDRILRQELGLED